MDDSIDITILYLGKYVEFPTITDNFGVFVKLKNNIPGRFFVRNVFILSPSCISLTLFFNSFDSLHSRINRAHVLEVSL